MVTIFSTKLLKEEIKFNKDEILNVQWYDVDYVINQMDTELRNVEMIKHSLINFKNGDIASLNILNEL